MVKHQFHTYLLQHYSKNKELALDVGCAMRPYHEDYKCKYIGLDLPPVLMKILNLIFLQMVVNSHFRMTDLIC